MPSRLFENYARRSRSADKPSWVNHLVWHEHLSYIPGPIIEITHDEWFAHGICSDHLIIHSFNDILGIPNSDDPMLYDCHTDVYADYGLVVVSIECNRDSQPNMRNITTGLEYTGTWVQCQDIEGRGRLLRFFIIGLE